MGEKLTEQVAVRVGRTVAERIEKASASLGWSRAQVLREAALHGLPRLEQRAAATENACPPAQPVER